MKIIDAHMHFSAIHSFIETAQAVSGVDYSLEGLIREYAGAGVTAGIAMGVQELDKGAFPDDAQPNPMLPDLVQDLPSFLYTCIGINPVRLDGEGRISELEAIESKLRDEKTVGIKIYAGYYHYHVYDRIYHPVYELAVKYGLPVVIHSGATYSEKGLLKYSHPLDVDELAAGFRDITFVISHLGDPWVMDTAAVIYKNSNVYADLSGLIVADACGTEAYIENRVFMDHVLRGLVFEPAYDRFLFGTDWPLVPVAPYIDFVSKLVPEEFHNKVFLENALKVFRRLGKTPIDY